MIAPELEFLVAGSEDDRAFRFDLGRTPTPGPSGAGRSTREAGYLDLDLGDLGGAQGSFTTPPPPLEQRAEPQRRLAGLGQVPWGTGETPEPLASAPTQANGFSFAFDSEPAPPAGEEPASYSPEAPMRAPAEPTHRADGSPQLKRIAFPSQATRFSPSIGAARPSLESDDDLGLPEDLPGTLPAAPSPAPGPSLRDFARQAMAVLREKPRLAWDSCTDRAREGGRLANEFQRALRERQTARKVEPETRQAAEAPRVPEAPKEAAPVSEAKAAATKTAPVIDLAAWRSRALGPALTLLLAVGVYAAGSRLLGEITSPALSASSSVPDLGSIEAPAVRDPRPPEERKRPASHDGATTAENSGQAGPTSGDAPTIEMLPMPAGLTYPGKGLVEVVTSEEELIYVDGIFIGRGPLRRVPVTPGEHELSIRNGKKERHGVVRAEAGRATRALFVDSP